MYKKSQQLGCETRKPTFAEYKEMKGEMDNAAFEKVHKVIVTQEMLAKAMDDLGRVTRQYMLSFPSSSDVEAYAKISAVFGDTKTPFWKLTEANLIQGKKV